MKRPLFTCSVLTKLAILTLSSPTYRYEHQELEEECCIYNYSQKDDFYEV